MQEVKTIKTFSYITKMVKPFYWSIVVMFLVAIIWALNLSLRPYLIKVILDTLSKPSYSSSTNYILYPILFYFTLSFIHNSGFRFYNYFVEIKMIPALRNKIISSTFEYLLHHNHSYYQNNFSGSLSSKVNDLANSIPEVVQIFIDRFFSHGLGLLIAICTLCLVHNKFAIAIFVWSTLFIGISFLCAKKIQFLSDQWSELCSVITGKLVDVLSNILSVKLFSQQEKEQKSLNSVLQKTAKAEQKLQWFYFWMWLFYGLSFVLTEGVCLFFLISGYNQGTISVGDFALILALNISIVDFVWALTKDFSQFSKLLGKIKQALRTIAALHETQDKADAIDIIVNKGEIFFKDVEFSYKGESPLFQKTSVLIPFGQKVGLVGYSGSGKSTFINLIIRLYDVTKGEIFIDNQNIKDVTQNSLRNAISVIPQDPSLFHRTLKDNILYGKLSSSDEEIINAAKQAYAHEFISKLPLGYDSLVGERGVKLSGGQRQRIIISRAILKNSPILILDEATSQLDSITEYYIQESLWQLMKNKTTIIAAHRLSTLLQMDRILVFDQGKIVQDGTHEELLGKDGLYKIMWNAQIRGFLPENNPLYYKKFLLHTQ